MRALLGSRRLARAPKKCDLPVVRLSLSAVVRRVSSVSSRRRVFGDAHGELENELHDELWRKAEKKNMPEPDTHTQATPRAQPEHAVNSPRGHAACCASTLVVMVN